MGGKYGAAVSAAAKHAGWVGAAGVPIVNSTLDAQHT